ncbi:MAG: hypothetical protein AAF192_12805 [Pseudomonadota bacterium]
MTSRAPASPSARGAAVVGRLHDLRHVELASVMFLRLWCDGAAGQAKVRAEVVGLLGAADGQAWLRRFEDLLIVATRRGRRPLVRRAAGCACLCGDEALFATLVSTAAELEREEAAMLAALVVRADAALSLAQLAADVGIGIKRMGLRVSRSVPADASETAFVDAPASPDPRRPAPPRTLH